MLDLLILGHSQGIKHAHQLFRAKQAHQVVFEGNKELGFTWISLSPRTSTELIVDTPRLMTLRANDLKPACFLGSFVQFNIRTTARHIRSNGNCAMHSRLGHDLRLNLMELCIQHFMLNAAPLEHLAE